MSESLAYLNGEFIPASQAVLPATDAGFVQGVTVAEQMRTFGGQLFRLEQHLDRLAHSLKVIGVHPPVRLDEVGAAALKLADHNHALLDDGDDLGMTLFVTPGDYSTYDPKRLNGPRLCLHTYRIPFELWANKYRRGQPLIVSDVRQVPPSCWPVELKCRSRMHYFLADQEAQSREQGARALLLDQRGLVVEASTANVVIYRDVEGFVSPPLAHILPGISLATMAELAQRIDVPLVYRDLSVQDVYEADEVMLTSTSPCLLPAPRVDGRTIGNGDWPMARRMLSVWSEQVGVDIVAQAERHARHGQ